MKKRKLLYKFVSFVILAFVIAAIVLAANWYFDEVEWRKDAIYEAYSTTLILSEHIHSTALDRYNAKQACDRAKAHAADRLKRCFVLEAGKVIKELGISKPSRFLFDTKGRVKLQGEDEKIDTLVRELQSRCAADECRYSVKQVAWFEKDAALAVLPVLKGGKVVGAVGVQIQSQLRPQLLIWYALLFIAVVLGLFALSLVVCNKPFVERTAGFVVLAVLLLGLTFYHSARRIEKLSLSRDSVTTYAVANLAFSSPKKIHDISQAWSEVWKGEGPSVRPLSGTRILVYEPRDVQLSYLFGRAVPVAVVVVLLFVVSSLLYPGLAEVVEGVVTMPGVYAYIAPAMLGMFLLILVPFVIGVGLGFFNTEFEFVGLQNFGELLFPTEESQTNFYFTLGVTILWTVSNVTLHVIIGLFLALILNSARVRWKGIFRVLLIVPWAVPNYITALVWRWMFSREVGAIWLLMKSLGLKPINWFGPSFWTNFLANLITNVWLGFPFMMVVSLGALQSIPKELYEAADIDGASAWQKFRYITLPLLKPALFPAIILGTIWTFNMFNVIYLVSHGAPDNKTNILITEAYRFFHELNMYGMAAAYCVMIFIILLVYTLITNKITKATEGAFE